MPAKRSALLPTTRAPQVNARLDQLAPAAPADGAAAPPAADGEQMDTDAAAGAAAAEAASPFAKRLALFKARPDAPCLALRAGVVGGAAGRLRAPTAAVRGCRRAPQRSRRQLRPAAVLPHPPPWRSPAPVNTVRRVSIPPPLGHPPQTVLSGEVPIELERQFLARHNHADLQVRGWAPRSGCPRG